MGNNPVDSSKKEALYLQVKDIIVQRIKDGVWQPDDLIPTEAELMQEFNVSRTTIRQAISLLVQEGIITKKQGKGTFVKRREIIEQLGHLTGFAEESIRKGFTPGARVMKWEWKDNLLYEKSLLNRLNSAEKILRIERVRFMDHIPVAVERTYWSEEIGNILLKYDLNTENYYEALEQNGILLKDAKQQISAINAPIYDSELLGIEAGTALLEMSRVSYGLDGNPIEYAKTRYRTDYYKYNIELKR